MRIKSRKEINFEYLKKWCSFFNIEFKKDYQYEFQDVQITFQNKKDFLRGNKHPQSNCDFNDYILVTDRGNGKEILKYDFQFIRQVAWQISDQSFSSISGKYSEKLVLTLLLKIVSEYPAFIQNYRRIQQEQTEYKDCLAQKYLNLDTPSAENFPIEKFEIFKFYSLSESCKTRVGKDDLFTIYEKEEYFVKYNNSIIVNAYLKTLLPPKRDEVRKEYVYGPSAIGSPVSSFRYDSKETKIFREKFVITEFLSSLK